MNHSIPDIHESVPGVLNSGGSLYTSLCSWDHVHGIPTMGDVLIEAFPTVCLLYYGSALLNREVYHFSSAACKLARVDF